MHYFGLWSDAGAALQKYLDQRDHLHAGRTPRAVGGELLVRDVLNHFLTAKKLLQDAGEITAWTWADYHATCERIKCAFGATGHVDDLRGEDFSAMRVALAKQ